MRAIKLIIRLLSCVVGGHKWLGLDSWDYGYRICGLCGEDESDAK